MATTEWRTGLAHSAEGTTFLRGVDVCELMATADFPAAAYFYITGRRATPAASRLLNAVLISFLDHGIAPASVITRIVASAGVPLTPSVAAGLLSIGDLQTGTGDLVAGLLQDALRRRPDSSAAEIAENVIAEHKERDKRIVGYGHPLHGDGDPRCTTLQKLIDESGLETPHVDLARAIETALGPKLRLNVVGLCAATLSDLGLDPRAVRSYVYTARSAGLTAHYLEEIDREGGWRIPVDPATVTYDGPAKRSLADVDVSGAAQASGGDHA